MPTLENPYASPIGGSLSNLAKAFMTGPTEAERVIQAENALKLQRQRQGITDTATIAGSFGTPGYDRNKLVSSAILGGYKPEDLAIAERFQAANGYGAKDPRTTNAFVGAGGSYDNTGQGFDQKEAGLDRRSNATIAEQRYQFDSKPQTIGSPEGPKIVRTSESYGQPAVEDIGKVKGDILRRGVNSPGGVDGMSPATKVLVGADKDKQSTPHNYLTKTGQMFQTYDGTTDARTGAPLPPGLIAGVQGTAEQSGLRPNVQGELQKADIENQKFRGLLNFTRQQATDPSNFGVSGFVKGLAQDATQMSDGIAKGLGYTGLQQAVESAKQTAISNGVDPKSLPGLFTFDPKLPSLHTAADLLVYQAASALAGQSGRSVSDKDVHLFRNITGDPRDWLGNQDKYLAKLDTIEQILGVNQAVIDKNLRSSQGSAATPAAPGATPPPAPGAPQTPQVEEWGRGPDGSLQRVR